MTARQQQILDYIVLYIDSRGYPPTLREICKHFGFGSTNSAHDHLAALEKKGFIRVDAIVSRGIQVLSVSDVCPVCKRPAR